MKALMTYWPIAALFIQVFTVWVCWSLRQLAKTEVGVIVKAVDDKQTLVTNRLDERADAHHDRIVVAEGHIKELRDDITNLPTKADIASLAGEVKKVGGEVVAANAGIQRLEGFFLKRGVESV